MASGKGTRASPLNPPFGLKPLLVVGGAPLISYNAVLAAELANRVVIVVPQGTIHLFGWLRDLVPHVSYIECVPGIGLLPSIRLALGSTTLVGGAWVLLGDEISVPAAHSRAMQRWSDDSWALLGVTLPSAQPRGEWSTVTLKPDSMDVSGVSYGDHTKPFELRGCGVYWFSELACHDFLYSSSALHRPGDVYAQWVRQNRKVRALELARNVNVNDDAGVAASADPADIHRIAFPRIAATLT